MPEQRRKYGKNDQVRALVSVSEMARMVGLSRTRFYSLIEEGGFPRPVYLIKTRRPVYTAEMQQECLEARERGIGAVSGVPIMFYCGSGRASRTPAPVRRSTTEAAVPKHVQALIDGLKQLGMEDPKPSVVAAAVCACYPDGTSGIDHGAMLGVVFRYLRATA